MAVSHCGSLHTKDLPEIALPTSSQPESLPYAAKIFFFIPSCTAGVHLKPLLSEHTHASCRVKQLTAPGHPPIRYHQRLLSPRCHTPFHPPPQSGDPQLGFTCNHGTGAPERLCQAVTNTVLVLCALNPLRGHEDAEPASAAGLLHLRSPAETDVNIRRQPQWRWRWCHLQPL